jgi:integrase
MIYKRGAHWHMDDTICGVRYREALATTDRREAVNLEKKRVAEVQAGKGASKSGREFARKLFAEAALVFLEEREGRVAPRTIQFERERLKPLTSYFANRRLFRLKAEEVAAYQRERLKAGLSRKTINMEIGVLRLILKRAGRWSVLADEVKLFPKHSRQIGKVLTAEQKGLLFQTASCKPAWLVVHCAATLAVSTTCRSIELKHLRWGDVDLFNRVMSVKRSKTEAGCRTIPLNSDAVAAFVRLKERAQLHEAGEPDHFVFPACENERVDAARPQKTWRSAWRSLVKETARRAGRDAAKAALEAHHRIGRAVRAWR